MTPARIATPVVLLLTSLLLAACGREQEGIAEPPHLRVTVQGWTGWSEEQPEPTVQTEFVQESESFTVFVAGDDLEVTLVEVGEDELVLETSEPMAPRSADGGGWDHNDIGTEFTLDRGGSVELSTPTLDAGTSVVIAEQ